jgi:hypothetical protein
MKTDATRFWARFNELVSVKYSTLGDFCSTAKINYDTLITQRNRKAIPKIEQLLDMARALNITVDYLVTGKEPTDTLTSSANADPSLRELLYRVLACNDTQRATLATMMDSWGIMAPESCISKEFA